MVPSQPWKPADATIQIRALARHERLTMTHTNHVKERLEQRRLTISDVLYVLKNGFVYEQPEAATRVGWYKYRVESGSPNSGRRILRVVAIPSISDFQIKTVTIMFVDES